MDKTLSKTRKGEQGQTILLVALALFSLLAMAALAIDVATLYVARSEAQRAANAAAIAGAKIFATSSVTSLQGGGGPPTLPEVCTAATAQAQAVALQNTLAGQPAVATVTCNLALTGNPQVNVTVGRAGLPTFFAKIWSRATNSVNATAIAEAYNPSGHEAPIQVSVKPWYIPNCDVNHAGGTHNPNCAFAPFVNSNLTPNDGSITGGGLSIGQTIIVSKVPNGTPPNLTTGKTVYFPLDIPVDYAPVCPSTGAISCAGVNGGNDYLDNIACASQHQISCGDIIGRGETVSVDGNNVDTLNPTTTTATQCLIHTNGLGDPPTPSQQDAFTVTSPSMITGGSENPNPNLQNVQNISRSDSVVTVPLYDGVAFGPARLDLCRGGGCNRRATVVGFLQLGIMELDPPLAPAPPSGSFKAVVLNIAGCHPAATGNTVSGGGVSPVPVRLITQ